MINKLKSILLGSAAFAATADNPADRRQLALAALLVEMARADFDEQHAEQGAITHMLAGHFELTPSEAQALLARAMTANSTSVSLFDFTRALHESLDAAERCEVVRLLWQVANVDSKLDKYESYLVQKVADLLHVSHSDVIRIKHEVAASR